MKKLLLKLIFLHSCLVTDQAKKEYLEKKWLSKDDISLSVRALRLLKDKVDIPALMDMYIALRGDYGEQEEEDE